MVSTNIRRFAVNGLKHALMWSLKQSWNKLDTTKSCKFDANVQVCDNFLHCVAPHTAKLFQLILKYHSTCIKKGQMVHFWEPDFRDFLAAERKNR